MRKITVFNNVSIDGYFSGPNGEISWFKVEKDADYEAFVQALATSGNTLMFGHKTYEMMKSFWPTEMAFERDPVMAGVMNNNPKIVFSKTMDREEDGPNWKNITVMNEVSMEAIMRLKESSGTDITILGSGTIVQQLTDLGLIDEYQLAVNPVILGVGRNLFAGVKMTNLKLMEARSFENGVVTLKYSKTG